MSRLQKLTPRISKLIETANALLENGYQDFLTPDEWGRNGWVSEGWAHKIGFMYDSWGFGTVYHISSMGIVNGGACGGFDFHTTGDCTYMTKNYGKDPIAVPLKENNAESFLKGFDDFESSFYDAVEIFLKSKSV